MASIKDNPFLCNVIKEGKNLKMIHELKELLEKEGSVKHCSRCGNKLDVIYSPKTLYYDYNGEERELIVKNAPYHKCKTCDDDTENLVLYGVVRQLLEKELFFKLNKREEIPSEVDLLEIAK
ncbi:hypothetical protein WMZ97_18755 [Lentibacillus sp. N15]|uniref:hypothetical protein n=1 Tax=Lentibacillus songyuanensis TaxID=3136161 RepID=UPI0031BA26A1